MTKLLKVLIVDGSRVVRASLAKHLRGNFDVCEEGDAESAWQSLVLDSSITAVVSGLDITHLDGSGLVERLRASKLARLNRLPFFLLVSDSFPDAGRELATRIGVSQFVPKKTAGPEIMRLLVNLVYPDRVAEPVAASSDVPDAAVSDEFGSQTEVGISDFMSRVGGMAGLTDEAPALAQTNVTGEPCLQASLSALKGGQPVAVLVFGLDGYEGFRVRYGSELADKIVMKFSRMLEGKIHDQESILHLVGGRVAIISSTAGREQCAGFARRICKALVAANISLRGEKVEATVSAGVAALPEDSAATSTDELLRLAASRLDAAVLAGGNRVVFVTGCGGDSVSQDEFFDRLKEMLAKSPPETRMSCKGWVTSVCSACRTLRAEGKSSLCALDSEGEECSI
ncbi:MAG: diguanylate cyclase [Azonexus sp.]|nr:diguanylate cyclase [Azonexus sp.]